MDMRPHRLAALGLTLSISLLALSGCGAFDKVASVTTTEAESTKSTENETRPTVVKRKTSTTDEETTTSAKSSATTRPSTVTTTTGKPSTTETAPPTTSKAKVPAQNPTLRDNLAQSFSANIEESSASVTITEANCVADAIINSLSSKRAVELGTASPADMLLTDAEADRIVPAVKKCINMARLLTASLLDDPHTAISPKSARCVADEFGALGLIDIMIKSSLPGADPASLEDPKTQATILKAFAVCLTPDEISRLTGR